MNTVSFALLHSGKVDNFEILNSYGKARLCSILGNKRLIFLNNVKIKKISFRSNIKSIPLGLFCVSFILRKSSIVFENKHNFSVG